MNVRTLVTWGVLVSLALLPACQTTTEPEATVTPGTTHVRGTVMRSDNLSPITNAVVYDLGGLARDTSKSDGSFNLVYELLSQTTTSIVGTRSGFGNDTAHVTLFPGADTTIVLRLKADSTSPSGAVSSGKAANIVLIASSSENVSIRGTGANETALLLFEVRDSLGVAIGGSNKLTVTFKIFGGPKGGEYVFPSSAETDPLTGRVSTRVSSGTKAGVLQVVAEATVPGTATQIKSSPVRITISGGLPVAERFSISRIPLNIAGGVYDNLRAQVMVILGDKEGNPVQPGTAVSFTTTGGVVQPNALTDKDGIATVSLISGNPRPANSVAIVTAKTIGDTTMEKSTTVLFSGPTRILTPATTVVIPDSGVATFEYRVQDPNGFPLVGGTSVTLSVEGVGAAELELFGDVSKRLEDAIDPSTTLFRASVRDKKLKGPNGDVTFKITVTSQNGNSIVTFPGYVLADTSAVPPVFTPTTPSQSGYASNLALLSVSNPELSVTGTGAAETARLTFIARDSVGTAVEIRKRAYVTFSISPIGGVGGGEFLFPTGDSTDAAGMVSTTLNAGTRAGVIQVVARANVFGRTIMSSPVRVTIAGGLPDSSHFTATLSKLNMPGLVKTGTLGTLSVQVGDKFGNPVQTGTALYFSTTGGLISATSTTDGSGQATAIIQGGNPMPNDPSVGGPGFGKITVQTVGEGGVAIRKTVPFLFSGAPRVTLSNVPNDTVRIFDGSFFDVDYVVADANGNPLSEGHSISVSVQGQGAGEIILSGNVNQMTSDTQDKVNFTRFRFRAEDRNPNGGTSGDFTFSITVTGESGTFVRKFYGVLFSPEVSTYVPPSARQPSQIAFLGITNKDIYVAGVGNTENTVITYEVRDSLGIPIDKLRRVYATYTMQFYPNSTTAGGTLPTIIPAADSTDDSGKLRASVASGTQAGVIQLLARIQLPSGTVIISQPVKVTVHAGFPDQGHFTLLPQRYVFPGFDAVSNIDFRAFVADTFSNPVQQNTAVYFHSQAGLMTTGNTSGATASYTGETGQAHGTLYTVNPRPAAAPFADLVAGSGRPGYTWVYAQTQGSGARKVIDSVLVVWNKAPIVVTGIPVTPPPVPIPQGGTSAPITITVKDANGNPLCDGTIISASVSYTTDIVGVAFGVSGDLSSVGSFVMPTSAYTRFPGPNITDFTFSVSDLSSNGAAPVGQTVIVNILIEAPSLALKRVSFPCVVQ